MTFIIVPRSGWNARPWRERQSVSWTKRTGFVVHHSGAPANQSVRAIQDYQMDKRGWSDIGYNFLIGPDGRCFTGRDWGYVGAHATGYNTATIGVCLIGDYMTHMPTAAAISSLINLYDAANHIKGRKLALFGHREVGHTDCPGDQLFKWISSGAMENGSAAPNPGTPAPSMDHRPGTRELRHTAPAMSGADVRYVQRFVGPAHCGAADGSYGPHTRAGVLWYQGMRGLKPDGIVGPSTWRNMEVVWTG
jgi:peptidoglycan hydrolase-like protein with peptidoglycan-binding domain